MRVSCDYFCALVADYLWIRCAFVVDELLVGCGLAARWLWIAAGRGTLARMRAGVGAGDL